VNTKTHSIKIGTSEITRAILATALPPAAKLVAVAAATFIGRQRQPDGSAVVYLAVSQLSALTGYTSDRTLRTHIQTLQQANLPWLQVVRHRGSRAAFHFVPAIATDAGERDSGKKRRGRSAQAADSRGNHCRTGPEEFADERHQHRQTVPAYTTGTGPDERAPDGDHAHQRPARSQESDRSAGNRSAVSECATRPVRPRARSEYDRPRGHYPRPFDGDADEIAWWETLIDLDGHRYAVPREVKQVYDATNRIDNPAGYLRYLCRAWERDELVLAGASAIRQRKTARERERERIKRELGIDPETGQDEAATATVIDHDALT